MQVDSGAPISAISVDIYKKKFSNVTINNPQRELRGYDKKPLATVGYINVNIEREAVNANQILYVVKNGGPPIVGRNWLRDLKMWPLAFNHVTEDHKKGPEGQKQTTAMFEIKREFPKVFAPGLGLFTKGELTLKLKTGATPKFIQPRRVPIAMRTGVETEIKRLQTSGIISPIEFSEWGTPVVPVVKEGGKIRLCGDYKVTLNKFLDIDHYPLPRLEEILDVVRGAQIFSKLDLAEAYQQLPLSKESQELVVISTHLGLFKYHRLPYGVSTGPGSFQRVMSTLLLGMAGVIVFLDDILVATPSWKTHVERLREVLMRLNDSGLHINFEKCEFFQTEVKYVGYHITGRGIYPLKNKIDAVKEAPRPKDELQLRSFLGSINYYSRFIENMAQKLRPLFACLETGKFEWTDECSKSFEKIKSELASEKLLIHFDPRKPIVLTCDASPYGVGAVLAHRESGGFDRPICFASRTLSSAEKNYAHIEKEGLAVIFGIRKFFGYLWGHKFILQTDNAALTRIFHPEKAVPEIAAARLQRWAIFLMPFRYEIKHIKGNFNYADWLSRIPISSLKDKGKELTMLSDINYTYLNYVKEFDFATLDWKVVRKASQEDKLISKIMRYCVDGWSESEPKEENMRNFWQKRDALTVDRGCLMWGYRVVIPESLRTLILGELHASHFGVTRMKEWARAFVWWPLIDGDIESITKKCEICLKTRKNPPKVSLTPWRWPTTAWHRIHADFLGPLGGKTILIIIDSHSKWPEAYVVSSMGEETTIATFDDLFSRFGYPVHLVTDNYSTFIGQKFQKFLSRSGIRHSTTPPYFPATNGAAENFVDTIKRKTQCLINEGHTIHVAIRKFLSDYRNTPHAATGKTPASLFLGRELRTRMSLLRPPAIQERITEHQERMIRNRGGGRVVKFTIGDSVMAREYSGGKEGWTPGIITSELTPGRTYEVEVSEGRIWKRHVDQLSERAKNSDKSVVEPGASNEVLVPAVRRSERVKQRLGARPTRSA